MQSEMFAFLENFVGPVETLKGVLDPYWPTLIVAIVVSILTTPLAGWMAFRLRVLDMPDDAVKTHKRPTAYLGGVAVLVGFIAAMLVGKSLITRHLGDTAATNLIFAIIGGATLATLVGLIDDIKDIRPWQKLLGQAVCSLFLVLGGISPDLNNLAVYFGINVPELFIDIVGYLVVLFFVLGATNSLNLLDGLDGLCAGTTAIITLGFLALAVHLATWGTDPMLDGVRIVVALALTGAAFGFLMFNRHPAAIFLGDAGSIFLGFIIAAMMMMFAATNARWWMASVVIFGLPILDTATALIRRILNKRPIMLSDRGHIYDQMIDRGISLERTIGINYLLAGIYVLLGLAGAMMRASRAIWLYLAIAVISLGIVWWKGFFKMEGNRGAIRIDKEKS